MIPPNGKWQRDGVKALWKLTHPSKRDGHPWLVFPIFQRCFSINSSHFYPEIHGGYSKSLELRFHFDPGLGGTMVQFGFLVVNHETCGMTVAGWSTPECRLFHHRTHPLTPPGFASFTQSTFNEIRSSCVKSEHRIAFIFQWRRSLLGYVSIPTLDQ